MMDLLLITRFVIQTILYLTNTLKVMYLMMNIIFVPDETLFSLLITMIFTIVIGTYVMHRLCDCVCCCGRIIIDILLFIIFMMIVSILYLPNTQLTVN